MQRLHHVAELVDRPERVLPRAVRLVRREERHRLVAPVVDATVPRRDGLHVELENRQQLHRGHAQLLQVRNLLDQAGVGAPRGSRHARARVPGEPTHVHLVHHRPRRRGVQGQVAFPVVRGRIDDDALHRRRRVVAVAARGVAAVTVRDDDAASVRVEQDLFRIEAMPVRRIEGPVDSVPVDLPRPDAGHEHVPVVILPVRPRIDRNHARRPCVVHAIEEQQLDARSRASKRR